MKIFLSILSLAVLCGCSGAPPFPSDVHVFVVDIKNSTCAEYEIIDVKNMKFRLKAEHELVKCQDVFGFNKPGFKSVQNWIRQMQALECKQPSQ